MKKIVELVDMSFKNSQEYFKQSIDIQHLKADFVQTLSAEQKHILIICWIVFTSFTG